MNLYQKSAWFAAIVSIVLIIRGLVTSISATDLDTMTIIVANILPIILLYVSICLMRVKDRKGSATTSSIITSIVSLLWFISLIPGVPIIATTIIIMVNFFLLVAALLAINWYLGRAAGLIITLVILFIMAIFVGGYGASMLSSKNTPTSTATQTQ